MTMEKEQEEKLALVFSKAGLSQHFSAFVREKVMRPRSNIISIISSLDEIIGIIQ